ncbi:hypothetical protein HH665_004810 [Escherichia coli]|nr:hypothetical protein [Escherichia coli]
MRNRGRWFTAATAPAASRCGCCNQVNHLIPTRVLVKGGEITCKMLK